MIEFSKDKTPENCDTVAVAKSPHEVIRKAIACCNGEDKIVVPIDFAMDLVMEWDRERKTGDVRAPS